MQSTPSESASACTPVAQRKARRSPGGHGETCSLSPQLHTCSRPVECDEIVISAGDAAAAVCAQERAAGVAARGGARSRPRQDRAR
eukprot:6175363-Pleurochrysis_carterae.AAC.1